MTRQVQANELTGVDVQLISLVKRGANRLPFRLIKKDTSPMIDLVSWFRKSENAQAARDAKKVLDDKLQKEAEELAAATVDPAAALVNAQEILKAAGYTVMTAERGQSTVAPDAATAVAADAAAGAQKPKPAEGKPVVEVAGAAKPDAAKEALDAEKAKAKAVVTKKAELIAELQTELASVLVDLEKASTPQALADAVNKGKNKQTQTADGMAATESAEGDEPVADAPVHGNEDSTAATRALVMKLEEMASGQIALAAALGDLKKLFKSNTEETAKRLGEMAASVKKAEEAVLGEASDDNVVVPIKKSSGELPPLLDTYRDRSRK